MGALRCATSARPTPHFSSLFVMMHRSSALSLVFDIPLIRNEITASLSQHEVAQCSLVNFAWNAAFASLLWKDLLLSNQRIVTLFQTSPAIRQGLHKNADHVRSIRSFFCYAFQSLAEMDGFRNLVRLDSLASELHNKGIVDHTNTQRLLQFVKVNIGLKELVLSNFPLASVPTSKLLGDTLVGHPGLVSVTVNCFREADLSSIQHVLRGAGLGFVEKLSLICRSRIVWTPEMNEIMEKSHQQGAEPYGLLPEQNVVTHLRDLKLDGNLTRCLYITLLPILRHSPHLERLYVPCVDVPTSFKDLCPVLEQCCQRLRHLECGFFHAKDEDLAILLNSCQNLRSYIMQSSQAMGPHSVRALLQHHSLTLERLSIKPCIAIASSAIQLILTSCPNLTLFDALSGQDRQDIYDPRLDVRDLPIYSAKGPAWVCRGLQELHIGFTGFSTLAEHEPVQLYIGHIYDQLAALTELRTLYLAGEIRSTVFETKSRVWAFDFTLASGIGKLNTLKKLRTLSVQRLKHHRIGKEEMVWMMDHWPSFSTFYTSPGIQATESSGNFVGNNSAKWNRYLENLARLRPSLVISVGAAPSNLLSVPINVL